MGFPFVFYFFVFFCFLSLWMQTKKSLNLPSVVSQVLLPNVSSKILMSNIITLTSIYSSKKALRTKELTHLFTFFRSFSSSQMSSWTNNGIHTVRSSQVTTLQIKKKKKGHISTIYEAESSGVTASATTESPPFEELWATSNVLVKGPCGIPNNVVKICLWHSSQKQTQVKWPLYIKHG